MALLITELSENGKVITYNIISVFPYAKFTRHITSLYCLQEKEE